MNSLTAPGIIIALAWLSVAVVQCQLSCNSQLRLLPQFSHLFTHCGDDVDAGIKCTYGEWSEWAEIGTKYVPASKCPSKKEQTEERWKKVIHGTCKEKREERSVCKFCPVYICACATSPIYTCACATSPQGVGCVSVLIMGVVGKVK